METLKTRGKLDSAKIDEWLLNYWHRNFETKETTSESFTNDYNMIFQLCTGEKERQIYQRLVSFLFTYLAELDIDQYCVDPANFSIEQVAAVNAFRQSCKNQIIEPVLNQISFNYHFLQQTNRWLADMEKRMNVICKTTKYMERFWLPNEKMGGNSMKINKHFILPHVMSFDKQMVLVICKFLAKSSELIKHPKTSEFYRKQLQ